MSVTLPIVLLWSITATLWVCLILGILVMCAGLWHLRQKNHKRLLAAAKPNSDFLFDALHAIKWSILSQPKEQAAHHLSVFENLMRTTLESNHNKNLPLERAVIVLQQYLQLENVRLQGQLSYSFKIDAALSFEQKNIAPDFLEQFCAMELWHHITAHTNQKPFEIELTDNIGTVICLLRIKSKIMLEEKIEIKILKSYPTNSQSKSTSAQQTLPIFITL